MDKTAIEKKINKVIDEEKERIIAIGRTIYKEPETGFKEFKTAKFVAQQFQELGFNIKVLSDIPGVIATYDTGKKGPHIAVLGELDGIINPSHPDADPQTGRVHACGHHVQIAVMLGTAMALRAAGLQEVLCGKVSFMAVPAEEFIEVNYRSELRRKGIIKYYGGKAEFLHRGLFDTVDLCMMMHVSVKQSHKVYFPQGTNGFITKKIKYTGKASHAGDAPEEGINALYAANIGLMAANALRETFKEEDCIRFHPIMTKGGESVNVIPEEVQIEAQLRAKTIEAAVKINKKINDAFIGGAVAMGAQVEIEDLPGYMPFSPDQGLNEVCKKVLNKLIDETDYIDEPHGTYSLDIGDLSTLMPALHPFVKGASGVMHGSDYHMTDDETAYVLSTKMLTLTALELLEKDGQAAEKIIKNYQPIFKSKTDYFVFVDNLFEKNSYTANDVVSKSVVNEL